MTVQVLGLGGEVFGSWDWSEVCDQVVGILVSQLWGDARSYSHGFAVRGGERAVTQQGRHCVGVKDIWLTCWCPAALREILQTLKLRGLNTTRTEMKLLFTTRVVCQSAQECLYLSQSRTVFTRWAIVNTVLSLNWVLSMDWIWASVSRSTAAVASSRMRILAFCRSALARQSSCFWPVLQR